MEFAYRTVLSDFSWREPLKAVMKACLNEVEIFLAVPSEREHQCDLVFTNNSVRVISNESPKTWQTFTNE